MPGDVFTAMAASHFDGIISLFYGPHCRLLGIRSFIDSESTARYLRAWKRRRLISRFLLAQVMAGPVGWPGTEFDGAFNFMASGLSQSSKVASRTSLITSHLRCSRAVKPISSISEMFLPNAHLELWVAAQCHNSS
jgi:hypothetical protein